MSGYCRFASIVLGLALLAPLSGCAETKPAAAPGTLAYTQNAKAAYERAVAAYLNRDWEEATSLFQEVTREYSQSRYARMAELRLADVAFEQDNLAEAVGSYKAYVQAHRNDPAVEYARYRITRALYLQISDSMILPPQEERDQATVRDAHRELRRFIEQFPDSKYIPEVRFMLEAVTGRLVRHELYVARFYLREDNFEATVARVQHALRTFEGSGLEPEAMVLLGETYLKMHKWPEAREAFERVLTLYPDSPFTVPARSFLAEMKAAGRPASHKD